MAFLLFLAVSAQALASLPKDANGWSILTPSADSRIVYVSSVSGNDATGTYYLPSNPLIGPDPMHPVGAIQPFATYAAAYAWTRSGYPDWILFKRGETWTAPLGTSIKSGRANTERFIIASYGSSTERPTIKTAASTSPVVVMNGNYHDFAIVGLHFYSSQRDPNSPDFLGYADGTAAITLYALSAGQSVQSALVEDCYMEWFGGGFNVQGRAGTTVAGIELRRNIVAYNTDLGLFIDTLHDLLLEENVFDHNGWYDYAGTGHYEPTMFHHNTYTVESYNVTFAGNMFLRAASMGTKFRSDIDHGTYNVVVDDNLYVEGELGIDAGAEDTAGIDYRFANMTISNNVIQSIGRDRPTRRDLGWAIGVYDWDGGVIENNLILRQDSADVGNAWAISVKPGRFQNTQIRNNTVYQMLSSVPLIQFADGTSFYNVHFSNNIVDTNTYTTKIGRQSGSFSNYTLNNNKYYTGAAASAWFEIAGVNKSFAQWQTAAGESGSTTGHGTFADATRTVETYDAAQGGPGTFAHFIAQAKAQSKASWNTAWTAAVVNDWIRDGFTTTSANVAPAFTTDPFTKSSATEDSAYSGSISGDASDPNAGDTLTFSKQSGPAWLSVASNGALSGTPTNANVGANQFTVRVTDQGGLYDDATMNITVTNTNDAPAFTTDPFTKSSATEDSAYSGSISGDASDPDAGDTLTFSKQSGPAWLSVASNGALSGTPTNANVGANQFTVRVTDAGGLYDDATMNITVINVNDSPVFVADPITKSNATEDSAYSGSLAADASDPDAGDTLTFSKQSGPSWLSVASNGALSGTPTNANVGANQFTVRVTDAGGLYDDATLNITVINVNDAPAFSSDPIAKSAATVGSAYSGSLAANASDPDAGDTLTFSKQSGPSWLSVASNGALSGTPAAGDAGNNSWTVRVADAAGLYDDATLNITVNVVTQMHVDATYTANTSGWGVDHFATIQSAVNAAASSGVTITVHPGTYSEHVNLSSKNLVLTGTDPDDMAVIATIVLDGTSNGTALTCTNGQTSATVIQGLTIQHGKPSGIICNASPVIRRNVIQNNSTTTEGGGIFVQGGSPTIERNIVASNTATNQNGGGMAVEAGSAIVRDNLVRDNTCFWNGGGIFIGINTCSPTVTGNTIVNNTVQWRTCKGGGIQNYNSGTTSVITNCVLWGNTAPGGGSQISLESGSTVTVSYCDVSGGQGGVYVENGCTLNWGAGNLNSDPSFASASDFHLTSASLCIDAANGSVATAADLEGTARNDYAGKANTGTGTPDYVDMGCYEY